MYTQPGHVNSTTHPSVLTSTHHLYHLSFRVSWGGAVASASVHTYVQFRVSNQPSLTCMSFDWGRKLEYWEKTHMDTGEHANWLNRETGKFQQYSLSNLSSHDLVFNTKHHVVCHSIKAMMLLSRAVSPQAEDTASLWEAVSSRPSAERDETKHLVQNTDPRPAHHDCNKWSGPWRVRMTPFAEGSKHTSAFGPQQGGLCLQRIAMVTRWDSSVSFWVCNDT